MWRRALCLAGFLALLGPAAFAADKAARLAARADKAQKAAKELWNSFVFEHEKLPDKDLQKLITNYEKAIDLFQQATEVVERPAYNGAILLLARRIAQARMIQDRRKLADRPKPEPKTPTPPQPKPEPKTPAPKAPEPKPEPNEPDPEVPPRAPDIELDSLPKLNEDPAQRRRGIQGVRNFLMHYYFANRKSSALITRCPVCNGTGRRKTNQLDRRRRIITVPCNSCHESGAHLNEPAARKGFWLCMSPLYRSDAQKRAEWEAQFSEWDNDPRKIPEFLKTVQIKAVDYHGLWADVTWVEKGRELESKRRFQRTIQRKVIRAGKRWFFYEEQFDEAFFKG